MSHIEPFIRWAGGKTWLVPFMKQLTQDLKYKNYYEPFLGGAAVFFSLTPPKHAYLSDINADLIDTYSRFPYCLMYCSIKLSAPLSLTYTTETKEMLIGCSCRLPDNSNLRLFTGV